MYCFGALLCPAMTSGADRDEDLFAAPESCRDSELSAAPHPRARGGALVIAATDLTKVYAGGRRALIGVSLRVHEGEIVGVVGPNGAGKSTALKILSTVFAPSSGTATVCGHDLSDAGSIRPCIGVALQDVGLDPLMTGHEHFTVQASLYGVPRDAAACREARLVERFGLSDHVDQVVGAYSGGTQRRLSLALALLHEPKALIFDEPTVGLDPRARRQFMATLRELRDQGHPVLLSTQYLEEANQLCQYLYVIDEGAVVAEGSPADLRAAVGGLAFRVTVGDTVDDVASRVAGTWQSGQPRIDGEQLVFHVSDQIRDPDAILAMLRRVDAEIREYRLVTPDLDDVFIHFTGERSESEPGQRPMDMTVRIQRGGGQRWK